MPFTGGATPSPERTGGGENNTNVPALQRVYESLAGQRGTAYDQAWPPATAVAAENMALARAITFDLHGGNTRLANEFNPSKATVGGLLPRWEAILGTPPLPGDSQPVRQARVASAFARLGVSNSIQPVVDQVSLALGPLYGGITNFSPPDSSLWPGLNGTAAEITAFSSSLATVAGLVNIPNGAGGLTITLSNCATAANNGSWPIHDWVSTSSVKAANQNGVATDYGVGGSSGSPTIVWSVSGPNTPWTSGVSRIDILALLPTGYYTLNGSSQKVPNAAWWAAVAMLNPILDAMLPAWMVWQVYTNDSAGAMGFLLDEPDMDCEVFGT
jgi:hypothetical protein